ncbi:hypothetical protein [Denitromonas halophila]|nr:hypothetical protein [Denitromonas halophila]
MTDTDYLAAVIRWQALMRRVLAVTAYSGLVLAFYAPTLRWP